MQLPAKSVASSVYVRYGRYLSRRLRREGLTEGCDSVISATNSVKECARAWEDALDPVQESMADRDAADDSLDVIAQNTRLLLASRSLDAVKTSPYLDIFPAGIAYYTDARLEDQTARYGELVQRLNQYLSETDSVRSENVPKLESAISVYSEAIDGLESAQSSELIGRSSLESAIGSWRSTVESVYGTLVEKVGRKQADRFFPKVWSHT